MKNNPEFRFENLICKYIKVYYEEALKSTQPLLDSALEDPNVDRIKIRFESDSKLEGFLPLEFEAFGIFRNADPVHGLFEYEVEQRRREQSIWSDGHKLEEHLLNFSRQFRKDSPDTYLTPPSFKREVDSRIQALYELKENANANTCPIRICSLSRAEVQHVYNDLLLDIHEYATPRQFASLKKSLLETGVQLISNDIPCIYFKTGLLEIVEPPNVINSRNPTSIKMEDLLSEYVCHSLLSINQYAKNETFLRNFSKTDPSHLPGSEQHERVFLQIGRMRFSFPAEALRSDKYELIAEALQKQKRDDAAFEESVIRGLKGMEGPIGCLIPGRGPEASKSFLAETDFFLRENLPHGSLTKMNRLQMSNAYVDVITSMIDSGRCVCSPDVEKFKAKLFEAAHALGSENPKSPYSHPLENALKKLGTREQKRSPLKIA